jgi:nucleoid DNA-binding protein
MAGKRMSKSELITALAEKTGMNKKEVTATLEALHAMAAAQLRQHGEFVIPSLVKLTVANKPATPAREGINPFTKLPTTFKARPARKVVKASAVKALKDAL